MRIDVVSPEPLLLANINYLRRCRPKLTLGSKFHKEAVHVCLRGDLPRML